MPQGKVWNSNVSLPAPPIYVSSPKLPLMIIVAITADKRITPVASVKLVVAVATFHNIVTVIPKQIVGIGIPCQII